MSNIPKGIAADEIVMTLSSYPDDALVAVLGVAANVRGFRACMRRYANGLEPLTAISDSGTRERLETLQRIALRLATEPRAIPHPAVVDTPLADTGNQFDLLETGAFLKAQDPDDLAVLLVEGARAADFLNELDYFQKRLYPLAGLGSAEERERIYHLRLICGLLMATAGLKGFCKRYDTGYESPDGWR